METIEVRYKPIVTRDQSIVYHKYLVYTDSDGDKYATRGGPGVGTANIAVTTGVYNNSYVDWDPNNTDPREIIKTGTDLSADWTAITSAMSAIASEDHPYIFASENSNTTIDEALTRTSLPLPTTDGFGNNWAPGSEDSSFRLMSGSTYLVPTNTATTIDGASTTLPDLFSGQYYLFDPITGRVYVVNTAVMSGIDRALLISAPETGDFVTYQPGSFGNLSYSSGDISVDLLDSSSDVIGTVVTDTATGQSVLTTVGSSVFTFPAGGQLSFNIDATDGGEDITYTAIPRGTWHGHINPLTGLIDNISATFSPGGGGPDGGTLALGKYTSSLTSLFNRTTTDPIVLDLSSGGTGVELISLTNSSAYFDLHDSGFAVHTGWVGPTTGILVHTATPTSIGDLFGNSSTNGFTALKAADTNSDGVIDSGDAGFSSLYVWQDANGNGTADSGEVQSLSSLGITSINLNNTEVNETVNGNVIGSVATYTTTSGGGEVAEAFFNNSTLDSAYSGRYTLNPEVLLLPNLRGYGTLPDLYIAMSQDSTLLSMVQDLATDTIADAATFSEQITNILYRWAGVGAVDPTSRGDYANAQTLGVLEQFLGENYSQVLGGAADPTNANQSLFIELTFNNLLTATTERLLAQGPLASLLPDVSFNYDTDSLTGTIDFSALATAVAANAPTDQASAISYLTQMGSFMNSLATDLGYSPTLYDTTLQTAFATVGVHISLDAIDNLHVYSGAYDGSGNYLFDPVFATLENTTFDATGAVINGKAGVTNVLNYNGDISDSIITDVQTLTTYNITMRADELSEFSSIEKNVGYVGSIYAATAGTFDLSCKTTDAFNMYANSNGGTTLIGNDADGETLTASSSGNDTLQAGNGNDVVLNAGDGNDTLIAGSGTDTLYGGSGVDTLVGGSGSVVFHLGGTLAGGSSIDGGTGSSLLEIFSGDISGATISNVQTLKTGSITLTADELSSFSTVEGFPDYGGSIYAASAGTYDLSGKSTDAFNIFANSNDGTTLIGNDADGEILTASFYGNDTLQAGDGNDVVLYAGGGVDNILGGGGNDTILMQTYSLGAGTVIEGGAGTTLLQKFNGDISGATISGVQTLKTNSITLTADELSGFDSLENYDGYGNGSIYAATAGTYDLSGKTTDAYNMYANSNDGTTLIGDDADGQMLYASVSGNDTLQAGNGDGDTLNGGGGVDTLIAGSGVDTLLGSIGNTTFELPYTPLAGTIITGYSGASNTLQASYVDITQASISGVQTLQTNNITLKADQLSSFTSLVAPGGRGTINAATGGVYSIAGKTTDAFNMRARSSDGTTLIGNDAAYETLVASYAGNDTLQGGNGDCSTLNAGYGTGDDTLIAGNGNDVILMANSGNDTLIAGSGIDQLQAGSGVDTLIGGSGVDTFILTGPSAAGTTITGGTGTNILLGFDDISKASISNISTLQALYTTLTADQFAAFSSIELYSGFSLSYGVLRAATSGTYDLEGKSTSNLRMVALSNDGTTLIGNNADGETLRASVSGNDTLQAGSGNNDRLVAGGGNDIMNGGSGYDKYKFGPTFGQDVVNNDGGSSANGEIVFSAGTTEQNLWFQQSGNNLQIDLVGTNDQITVNNWFGRAGAQVQSFDLVDGHKLDSQIAALVTAMATYSTGHPTFNPAIATAMPTDATLQTAIASSWHA